MSITISTAIQSVTPTFADTSFFVAYLSPRDEWHDVAHRQMRSFVGPILTTDWVLVELGNWFSRIDRRLFADFANDLPTDIRFEIAPADRKAYEGGLGLYSGRPDKDWSFIDRISFTVMQDRGITEALTADHHFEQAGFRILLK